MIRKSRSACARNLPPHLDSVVLVSVGEYRYILEAHGLSKGDFDVAQMMASGTAKRAPVDDAAHLACLISGLQPNQAIGLGRLRRDLPDEVQIVTKRKLNG